MNIFADCDFCDFEFKNETDVLFLAIFRGMVSVGKIASQ